MEKSNPDDEKDSNKFHQIGGDIFKLSIPNNKFDLEPINEPSVIEELLALTKDEDNLSIILPHDLDPRVKDTILVDIKDFKLVKSDSEYDEKVSIDTNGNITIVSWKIIRGILINCKANTVDDLRNHDIWERVVSEIFSQLLEHGFPYETSILKSDEWNWMYLKGPHIPLHLNYEKFSTPTINIIIEKDDKICGFLNYGEELRDYVVHDHMISLDHSIVKFLNLKGGEIVKAWMYMSGLVGMKSFIIDKRSKTGSYINEGRKTVSFPKVDVRGKMGRKESITKNVP